MASQPVEALLFDMGGVVLDICFDNVFESMTRFSTLTMPEISARFSMDDAYQQHEKGMISGSEYVDHLRRQLQLDASDSDIIEAWNAVFGDEITPVLDAIEQISSRYPCDGFTNTNRIHQQYWDNEHPRIRKTFRNLFVSSEIGLRKPDVDAFEYISQYTGTELQNILFFDDTLENIDGAKRAGLQTVLVEGPQSVIEALSELP